MSENYTLVPMDRSHLSGVAELERMCFTTPWSEAMLEEELYNDTASFIVAEGEDGSVLGYAGLHAVLDEGYIDNVAVRPDCRRQGIADRLLDVFCRFGAANLSFLTLEVRPSNTAAVALYEKHGFAEAGRRRDYYENPKEDALLLTRDFGKEGTLS
ncbi:MAG: ribosomal protein S18-alanine N-acetyltransferase [Ruminiclostridium sp.]|jgi:ribosomal-protein-alanine N-acetyltransferase|nr:ribosomal protein S18-alanine N-acetyltransferase [Ruminiclostridium sp.]